MVQTRANAARAAAQAELQRIAGEVLKLMEDTRKVEEDKWHQFLYHAHYVHNVAFSAPNGDMTLIITGGRSDPVIRNESDQRIALTVCVDRLDSALPGWRKRVVKNYVPLEPDHLPVAELTTATPAVFQYLVAAAHHSSQSESPAPFAIDRHLTLNEVADIARLSFEYQASSLIAANVPGWVEEYKASDSDLDNERDLYFGQLEYLWIAFEFEVQEQFQKVCDHLIYVTKLRFWNPDSMPPGVYDDICRYREEYYEALSAEFYACQATTQLGDELISCPHNHSSDLQAVYNHQLALYKANLNSSGE